jgi:hypothetical protein
MESKQTTVRGPDAQWGGGAPLQVGDGVKVTGEHQGRSGPATVEGVVSRVSSHFDGRVMVTVDLAGGYRDTLIADEVWVHVRAKRPATRMDVAMGMAADYARAAAGAATIQAADALDGYVGYKVYVGNELVMRWPAAVCDRAGLSADHLRRPRSEDERA